MLTSVIARGWHFPCHPQKSRMSGPIALRMCRSVPDRSGSVAHSNELHYPLTRADLIDRAAHIGRPSQSDFDQWLFAVEDDLLRHESEASKLE